MPLDQTNFLDQEAAQVRISLLLDAANLIRKHGLAKHALQTSDGAICLVGALNLALWGYAHVNRDAETDMIRQLKLDVAKFLVRNKNVTCKSEYSFLPDRTDLTLEIICTNWNDRPTRTAAEVIEVLEATAATVRS